VQDQAYAIETDGLTRRFGGRTAVEKLELRVAEGDIYGFLGLNGAGKTTTIRLLLGLIEPDSGSVRIFGRPFKRDTLARIGSLVEMPSLYPHLTGRENLEVTRRQIGAPRLSIDRALAIVALRSDADRLVREYSLGMRQRLGVALALLNSPDLLILDEPTNGLDPAGIHEMRELLRSMPREFGVTVFLSSHLLAEVEQLAGSIGIIHQGRMVFQGSLGELRARQERRLRVGVRARNDTMDFLRAAGFIAHPDAADFITVEAQSVEADQINRLLVENGHRIFHLSDEEQSLEHLFLSLTGGSSQ